MKIIRKRIINKYDPKGAPHPPHRDIIIPFNADQKYHLEWRPTFIRNHVRTECTSDVWDKHIKAVSRKVD